MTIFPLFQCLPNEKEELLERERSLSRQNSLLRVGPREGGDSRQSLDSSYSDNMDAEKGSGLHETDF